MMPARGTTPRGGLWVVWALMALMGLTCGVLILADGMYGRAAYDHAQFHEPMVRQFIREWPALSFDNYLSATTPWFHMVVAAVGKYMSDAPAALRFASLAFTLALVGGLAWVCLRRGASALVVAAVCLPMCASLYVWPSGVWLLPDNAGWLGVLVILALALRPSFGPLEVVAASVALGFLVATRQIHLWAAGVIWAAAWIGGRETRERGFLDIGLVLSDLRGRFGLVGLALIGSVPAVLVVGHFANLWHGLVVPRYQGMHLGIAWITPAFSLSLLAVYSCAFFGWMIPALAELWQRNRAVLIGAMLAALALAVVPVSTYDALAQRKGGLWELARVLPVIGGRASLVWVVLAPAGAACLLAWLKLLPMRERWIMLAAWAGFIVAQTASPIPTQRYHEPMLLMWIALIACRARPDLPGPAWRVSNWMLIGPALLGVGFAVLTYTQSVGKGRADEGPRDPLTSPNYWGPPAPRPSVWTEERFELPAWKRGAK